ncbi:YCF48-related protein [Bacteroidota bacterium]
MKAKNSLTIIIILIIFISNNLYSGWEWYNPLPTGNELLSVFFLVQDTGWCVGKCGTIIKTTDGGYNWIHQKIPSQVNLNSIFFLNNHIGWAYGQGIFKTTDGGNTWFEQYSESHIIYNDFSRPIITFLDEYTGWIVDITGTIKTTNGGDIWLKDTNNLRCRIKFISDSIGFAISGNFIKKTTNRGIDWNKLDNQFDNSLGWIEFVDEKNGWADEDWDGASDPDNIFLYRTTDGGENWTIIQNDGLKIFSFQFFDTSSGWMNYWANFRNPYDLAYGSHLKITTNGGNDWITKYYSGDNQFRGFYSTDFVNCWVLTWNEANRENKIFKTTNNGDDWIELLKNSYPGSSFNKVYFFDRNNGWILDSWGKNLLNTVNSGKNWETYQLNFSISDICFINENTGFSISSYTGIYKTYDKGKNWSMILNDTTSMMNSIFFVDEMQGWISSYNRHDSTAYLFATSDAGQNWDVIYKNEPFEIRKIFFVDKTTGWAIAYKPEDYNPRIMKTIDGGQNWIIQNSTWSIRDLFFFDKNIGWASGYNGIILKTTDSGNNWIRQNTGNNDGWLKDIMFVDEKFGWVVDSRNDIILKTTDGGENWAVESIKVCNGLNGIHFIDSTTGWAVGNYGTILKFSPDYPTNIEEQIPLVGKDIIKVFPNPSNNNFKIIFEMDVSGNIELALYSLDGKLIDVISNLEYETGQHQIDYDNQNLLSGEYLIVLKINGNIENKKVLILK